MKEIYKIYLVFWSPLILLGIGFFLILLNYYQRPFISYPTIKLPQDYLQIASELKTLYPLNNTFLKQENIGIDFIGLSGKHFIKPVTLSTPSETLHLKMIYIEDKRKVCIINNIRVKEGERLKKNIKILRIGDYYVELQINNQIKKLFLGEIITI
ncbi:MAG: hypothetical protein NZ530_03900 [Thermodesulfobacteriaceae bacterium]|nr:hypothetical protein [Thermodesulfobacteriaceae bacterium]MCX8041016.1 hypothetical protein [Thermodesulfobacteriaceae bacterium]MDW8135255.1 hypothetical protein [Thermodesulfobacterium sp.]